MSFEKVIHISTDVGVKDIDDELLLKYILNNKIPTTIVIIFTGSHGISAGDSLAHWIRTYESNVMKKINPHTKYS